MIHRLLKLKGKKYRLMAILFFSFQFVFAQQPDEKKDSLKNVEIDEVSILGRVTNNVLSGSSGINIDLKKLALFPRLIGENDVYKSLQHIGGVSLSGESNAGLYVRGGSNDQNLVLLNDALILNPTHVAGLFSVFNSDVIGEMKFFKYAIPAEYGGRLSSVIDVQAIKNIPEKIRVKGSVGLISSKIMAQVPLHKKFSVYGAWRGSYLGMIIFPILKFAGVDTALTKNKYDFYDMNFGGTYLFSEKTSLNLDFYKGKDVMKIGELRNYSLQNNLSQWGNTTARVRLNHIFTNNSSMTHKISYSWFELNSAFDWFNTTQQLNSRLKDIHYKADFLNIIKNHQLKYGLEFSFTRLQPTLFKTDSLLPTQINYDDITFQTASTALYARDEWTYGKWLVNGGVRLVNYTHFGPYKSFIDDAEYASYSKIKDYFCIEPRLFVRYLMEEDKSFKFSAARLSQALNQVPVLSFGLPSDINIPATKYIKPQTSWHLSGGFFQNFFSDNYEWSGEIYYKSMQHQLAFNNSIANSFTANAIEKNLLFGRGWAYGAELKLQKNKGNFIGWLSYNLSWSYRQFEKLNKSKPFFDTNDRRHNLSLVGMYLPNEKWNFSALFVLASGNRLNLPLSWYIIDNKMIFEYEEYNSFTFPLYHRLDISATYKMKPIGNLKSELNFSVYNVYNCANPFQIYYDKKSKSLKMNYLLPVIPSLSWIFRI